MHSGKKIVELCMWNGGLLFLSQVDANFAFDMYREQYFEGGISSCYFWDQDNGGFAGLQHFPAQNFLYKNSMLAHIHVQVRVQHVIIDT